MRLPARRHAVVAAVLAWGVYLNTWRLGSAALVNDERIYAEAGRRYLHGLFDRNVEHPYLGKYLIGLSQAIFGQSPTGIRAFSVAASVLTGLVLYAFARREMGDRTGVAALALWLLLPHAAPGLLVRMDRYAILEPFLALFLACAACAGWLWFRTRRWRWAAATGVAVGLAVSCKVTGAFVLPVILLAAPAARRADRRWFVQAAAVVGLCGAVFVACYLPMGADWPEAVERMVRFHEQQRVRGHLVGVAGRVYRHPPWWAHLWFQQQNYGRAGTAALAIAVAGAVTGRARARTAYLAALILGILVFLVMAPTALPYYYLAWQPPLVLIAAAGLVQLASGSRRTRVLAVLAGVVLAFLAVRATYRVTVLMPAIAASSLLTR